MTWRPLPERESERDPERLAASVARFRDKHARGWRRWEPIYRLLQRF